MTNEEKEIVWNGLKAIVYIILFIFIIVLSIKAINNPLIMAWFREYAQTKLVDLNVAQYLILFTTSYGIYLFGKEKK
jgi:hypothetical protein